MSEVIPIPLGKLKQLISLNGLTYKLASYSFRTTYLDMPFLSGYIPETIESLKELIQKIGLDNIPSEIQGEKYDPILKIKEALKQITTYAASIYEKQSLPEDIQLVDDCIRLSKELLEILGITEET